MNAIDLEVEKLVYQLQAILRAHRRGDEAETLKAIFEKRFIWDQMALKVHAYLGTLLQDTDLPAAAFDVASMLRRFLQPYCISEHQRLVYEPARQLGQEIEHAGFPGWHQIVIEEIAKGATAGEIFANLAYQFNKFMNETPNIPRELLRKIRQFVSRLKQG